MNNLPAFPTIQENGVNWGDSGMTLRDYFAAHIEIDINEFPVSAELLMGSESPLPSDRLEHNRYWFEAEARIRYMKADAMMKAREA